MKDLNSLYAQIEKSSSLIRTKEPENLLPSAVIEELKQREEFVKSFSWAVPTREVIHRLSDFIGGDTCLEVFSGAGLWAALLQLNGAKVIPTDKAPPKKTYIEVRKMTSVDAVRKYPEANCLMMIWPPYASPAACEALSLFRGEKFIYCGEWVGGCTADDDFFKVLDRDWVEVEVIDIPQWFGIHDSVYLFTRRGG